MVLHEYRVQCPMCETVQIIALVHRTRLIDSNVELHNHCLYCGAALRPENMVEQVNKDPGDQGGSIGMVGPVAPAPIAVIKDKMGEINVRDIFPNGPGITYLYGGIH